MEGTIEESKFFFPHFSSFIGFGNHGRVCEFFYLKKNLVLRFFADFGFGVLLNNEKGIRFYDSHISCLKWICWRKKILEVSIYDFPAGLLYQFKGFQKGFSLCVENVIPKLIKSV